MIDCQSISLNKLFTHRRRWIRWARCRWPTRWWRWTPRGWCLSGTCRTGCQCCSCRCPILWWKKNNEKWMTVPSPIIFTGICIVLKLSMWRNIGIGNIQTGIFLFPHQHLQCRRERWTRPRRQRRRPGRRWGPRWGCGGGTQIGTCCPRTSSSEVICLKNNVKNGE